MPNASLIFLESICDDKKVVEDNIIRTKLNNPDYINKSANEAT